MIASSTNHLVTKILLTLWDVKKFKTFNHSYGFYNRQSLSKSVVRIAYGSLLLSSLLHHAM